MREMLTRFSFWFIFAPKHVNINKYYIYFTARNVYIPNGCNEPQVDMLDIPGKGRCCVFIARFSYDPPE